MFKRRKIIAAALAAAPVLAAAGAFAQQDQATAGISTTTTYTAEGRIAAVDVAGRTVTLTMADGSTRVVKVGPAVATLASVNVGDTVAATLEEKRTFVLSGPNIKTPTDRSTTAVGTGRMGNTRGAVVADKTMMTWWVTGVDAGAGTISLVDPGGGQVRTFKVENDAARANLSRVKPGDNLTAISVDVAAIALTRK